MAPDLIRQTQEILQAPLRWDKILSAAWQHGVASLLYKNVKGVDQAGAVPPEARRKLLQLYHRTAYRNIHLLKALGELLEGFARAGVKVIVLKGPCLAQLVYTDSASRPFLDLDLLIQKKDFGKARELLLDTGYTVLPGLLSERFAQRYHFNIAFVKREKVTTEVELHWNLTDRFAGYTLDIEGFWARAQPALLSNQAGFALSLEDLLTHLALHLDMHGYLNRAILDRGDHLGLVFDAFSENRLIWFTDLYEVIGQYRGRIDWTALLERSHRAGTDGRLATSLALLNRLFGPVVDSQLLKGLDGARSPYLKRKLLAWLLTHVAEAGEDNGSTRKSFMSKLLAKRRGVQFRLIRLVDLWDYILPTSEVVGRHVKETNRALLPLFYVIHVFQALAYCFGSAAQLLFYLSKKKITGSSPSAP
jgi:hypothetical protein